jgi:hypothetical protein
MALLLEAECCGQAGGSCSKNENMLLRARTKRFPLSGAVFCLPRRADRQDACRGCSDKPGFQKRASIDGHARILTYWQTYRATGGLPSNCYRLSNHR